MSLYVPATAVSLWLLPLAAGLATSAPALVPPSEMPSFVPTSLLVIGDQAAADAAALHAKRIACLKEAKDKKLVGAAKDAYVKHCVAGEPQPTVSGSPPVAWTRPAAKP